MTDTLAELPELTQEYQQQAEQAVKDAKVLDEFELVKAPLPSKFMPILWLVASALGVWFGMSLPSFGLFGVLVLIGATGAYLYQARNVKIRQTATLTEKGMIVTNVEQVPERCYTALRYFGYFVIAMSLVGLSVIGPLSLVGAGVGTGVLLVTYKMAGVVKAPKIKVTPLKQNVEYCEIEKKETFKNGVSSYFLLPYDYTTERAYDSAFSLHIYFYTAAFDAPAEHHQTFIKAVNQMVTFKEYGPVD
ncbi:hypothetical protein ACODM8_20230 [Vibrio ostreicida]|uniref:hypothetical protein n=1 Tax=Vibrio ostreicida TaxID=526588 RepID=UPI003B5CE60D